MGMFERYDNLSPDYIPNNSALRIKGVYTTIENDLPRPLIDIRGNQIGYTWDSGELFNFHFTTKDKITIFKDSIIYEESGKSPDTSTYGKRLGQKAYNTVDAKSWTFIGETESFYIWVEDEELLYPINGNTELFVQCDMSGKYIEVNITDFRGENLLTITSDVGDTDLVMNVNEEFYSIFKSGVYYCKVSIINEDKTLRQTRDKFHISIV